MLKKQLRDLSYFLMFAKCENKYSYEWLETSKECKINSYTDIYTCLIAFTFLSVL